MPLRATSSFPMGNACGIAVGDREGVPEVAFAPDPHGGPEALWFYLRVTREGDDVEPGRPVRMVLRHADTMLGGAEPHHLRPVLRRAEGDWERLPEGVREDLPDGRGRMVWTVPAPRTWLEIAVCYPYGQADLVRLIHDTRHYWRVAVVGSTQGGRPLWRLANDPGSPGGTRPGLFLLARQHSGETPGSWVMDGFLRWVAAHRERAPLVWAVPFANADGVEQGDYGKDGFPWDLNRAWGNPPMRHETVVLQRDLERWRSRCRPVFALDFHAPGACEAEGIYTFTPDAKKYPLDASEAARWAGIVNGALAPELSAPKADRTAYYASRWETPNFTAYCFRVLGVPALTLEVPYALCGKTVFTRELYRDAGERIAAAVCRAAVEGGA